MAIEIVMPRMGLTMEEGTLVAWLKNEGDEIQAGEPLLEIATDKTTMEIESPGSGILGGVTAQPDETFPVGTVIGYLLAEGESPPQGAAVRTTQSASPPPAVALDRVVEASAHGVDLQHGKFRASPAARHLARSLGVDLAKIKGTGPGGRVVAWNVKDAARAPLETSQAAPDGASPVARRLAAELEVDLSSVDGTGPRGRFMRGDVERVTAAQPLQPISRAHRVMADRMAFSFRTVPHFYLHAEVDARALAALRSELLPLLEESAGIRITITDLLVKLTALILARHPQAMAQWTEDGLRLPSGVHVGLAIDSPAGLIVPVIRDADGLGLVGIAERRIEMIDRASQGRLLPQDLELGVFTLTNLGMFRIDSFDAIINPPQAAILAVGRIRQRPMVEDGELIAAPMFNLSLSVDHRVLDGAAAARFLGDLVELIETPGLAIA